MKWSSQDNLSNFGIEILPEKKIIPLGDASQEYQVYKIPLELLNYNLSNGRIFMEVNKLQKDEDIDLSALRENNRIEFNNEIENLIWSSSEEKNKDTLEDIEKYTQLESGVVLDDGTVIDGNRRFTCLRRLKEKHPNDPRFAYFKAAILFLNEGKISKKDIKKYELKVQFGRDEKVDYKTINFNMSIYENIKSGEFTIQEMAENVNRKTSDISKIMATSELVVEMLTHINQENQLHVAEELNIYWPLEPLAAYLSGPQGRELSDLEKDQQKQLYFDYILTLDISLPTQQLREKLLNRILKNSNKDYKNEILEKHNEVYGPSIYDKLLKTKSDPVVFIDKVKEYRKSEEGSSLKDYFESIAGRAGVENDIKKPLKVCERIIENFKEINITPHLEASSKTADKILSEVNRELKNIIIKAESLIKSITEKLESDE